MRRKEVILPDLSGNANIVVIPSGMFGQIGRYETVGAQQGVRLCILTYIIICRNAEPDPFCLHGRHGRKYCRSIASGSRTPITPSSPNCHRPSKVKVPTARMTMSSSAKRRLRSLEREPICDCRLPICDCAWRLPSSLS